MPETEFPGLNDRLKAFSNLGKLLAEIYNDEPLQNIEPGSNECLDSFRKSILQSTITNPWFTNENIKYATLAWSEVLSAQALERWIFPYSEDLNHIKDSKKIAVISAGNIPFVGMHDFICTLLAGHKFIGKLSSNDKILLPAISRLLVSVEPRFEKMISFTEGKLDDFDAVIATGSNNTSRYFEYYFSRYPHIIRKNRNGVAVLDGKESKTSLEGLGSDICLYFGLGCRSISKVFIPEGYNPNQILDACEVFYDRLFDHFKYMNNYTYQKTILQINLLPYFDNGVIVLFNSEGYSSPISVVHFEYYTSLENLKNRLTADNQQIQCIATDSVDIPGSVKLGHTQKPQLGDYADGIDSMDFLLKL